MKNLLIILTTILIAAAGCGESTELDDSMAKDYSFESFCESIDTKELPLRIDCGFESYDTEKDFTNYKEFIPNDYKVVSQIIGINKHKLVLYTSVGDMSYPYLYSYNLKGDILDSLYLHISTCAGDPYLELSTWTIIDEKMSISMTDTSKYFSYTENENDPKRILDSTVITERKVIMNSNGNFTILSETKELIKQLNVDSNSPLGKELNTSMNNKAIDNYYKETLRRQRLIGHNDDNKMLSITDSLFSKDTNNDLFYFLVFTKSMNGSDGFYSEALGFSSLEFIETKTEWFADYFNVAPLLTEKDMDNWASYIYCEIGISRENHELETVLALEEKLLKNIQEARKEYRPIIKQLIAKIKKAHSKNMKE